ncbi:MAG TPA: hypothetical protein VMA34_15075 [Terracidiphilus sp.]|nr:hypothetical protein [Terracidiphilus sp.]
MKSIHSNQELEAKATSALRALLRQVSAIELREMKCQSDSTGHHVDILARVGVYGQGHTLACKVASSGQLRSVRKALRDLHSGAARIANATPVFIAPYLSPEAQALCAASQTGFLDLEENASLVLGEVFIAKRSMRCGCARPVARPVPRALRSAELRELAPAHAEAPHSALLTVA